MNKKNGGTIKLTQKKSYSRYFIILQEEEKGYSQSQDKLCSGYAKLEIKNDKCKISYYVQNLKKESVPYHMILICNKKDVKKLIKVGQMNIDENGRTEVSFEYPVDNIAGSNIAMDKVSGAAIVKFINSDIVSIMSGFATTDIPDWKKLPMLDELKRSEEEPPIEKSIFDKYEEKVEEVKGTDAKLHSEIAEKTSKVQGPENEIKTSAPISDINRNEEDSGGLDESEVKPLVEIPVEDKTVLEADEKRSSHKHEKKEKEYKEKVEVKVEQKLEEDKDHKGKDLEMKKYPGGSVGEFFKAIAEGFEELFDVCDEIKRCRWFRIPIKTIYDMTNIADYNKYTIMYYPMLNYFSYIKKYGHFLVGYKYDAAGKMKYIIYAVPGTKSKMEQPFEGKSGFVTWLPLKDGEDKEDNFGYWIMFYDFNTSTIIIPVK